LLLIGLAEETPGKTYFPDPEIETGCSTRLFKKRMEDVKQKRQAGDWFRFLEEGATIYIPTKS
jgi:hypothetical protein